ncbi:LCP family protein [Tissierella sp. MSJ-40]|uniref:LCP family protein n=1 Tax=Tissierella simiarum TaxID=2841534 RepID=A0ABS6E793_9FIRM|nr:LCP family protein [Tissierella simiarum]MBU5438782.1 LCP family protein [Tissierella simiarum]
MKKKLLLSFIIAFMCFTLIFMAVDRKFFSKNNSAVVSDTGSDEDINLDEKGKISDEILFLLMGIDDKGGIDKVKERKAKSQEGYQSTGNRSDTMMLCKVNFKTGEINIISIPRDTKVRIRGRKNDSKINAAYSLGGAYLAVDTVRDLLNIDLNYYVTVDYKAVIEIVDAIGGVEIDVPRDMEYTDPTDDPPLNINIKKGLQVLDGDKAHGFLRWRKNNDRTVEYPEGDIDRIKAQQMFMKELIKQTLRPKNILKLPALIETYFNNVETNIPIGVVLQGARLATKIDMDNITTEIIPGEAKYIGPTSYYIYDKVEIESLVKTMFSDYLLTE